jgi:hypothetical protein
MVDDVVIYMAGTKAGLGAELPQSAMGDGGAPKQWGGSGQQSH